MRKLIITLWCVALFIGTCTESVPLLFTDFHIHLNLNSQPTWSDLWRVGAFDSNAYIIQKIGHFFGFFILSLLMTNFGQNKKGLIWAIGYGVLTEILQPIFHRDARILDMLIDTAGALIAYYICLIFKAIQKKGT
ncbi:VanZ family protein [Paenibacillus dakarensis]|uniref:VanZ family protein n=1 Tax=Paenibacillus dakarensis TaxID=1527293 RepID=UPI0006D588E2